MIICPLSSGSKGNSTFIESDGIRFLIDAGLSGKKTQERLSEIDIDLASIDALFITHEHTDHIGGAGILARKYNIPIYINEASYRASNKRIFSGHEKINFQTNNIHFGNTTICSIPVSHDAVQTVAYKISNSTHSCAIATDMGFVTKLVKQRLKDCNIYLLETNYNEGLLKSNKNYPWPLKQRIMSKLGHLSNEAGAALFNELVNEKTTHVFLAHLSEENNSSDFALEAIEANCSRNKFYKKIEIEIAKQYDVSTCIQL